MNISVPPTPTAAVTTAPVPTFLPTLTIEEAIDAFNNTGIDVLWFPENNKGLIK